MKTKSWIIAGASLSALGAMVLFKFKKDQHDRCQKFQDVFNQLFINQKHEMDASLASLDDIFTPKNDSLIDYKEQESSFIQLLPVESRQRLIKLELQICNKLPHEYNQFFHCVDCSQRLQLYFNDSDFNLLGFCQECFQIDKHRDHKFYQVFKSQNGIQQQFICICAQNSQQCCKKHININVDKEQFTVSKQIKQIINLNLNDFFQTLFQTFQQGEINDFNEQYNGVLNTIFNDIEKMTENKIIFYQIIFESMLKNGYIDKLIKHSKSFYLITKMKFLSLCMKFSSFNEKYCLQLCKVYIQNLNVVTQSSCLYSCLMYLLNQNNQQIDLCNVLFNAMEHMIQILECSQIQDMSDNKQQLIRLIHLLSSIFQNAQKNFILDFDQEHFLNQLMLILSKLQNLLLKQSVSLKFQLVNHDLGQNLLAIKQIEIKLRMFVEIFFQQIQYLELNDKQNLLSKVAKIYMNYLNLMCEQSLDNFIFISSSLTLFIIPIIKNITLPNRENNRIYFQQLFGNQFNVFCQNIKMLSLKAIFNQQLGHEILRFYEQGQLQSIPEFSKQCYVAESYYSKPIIGDYDYFGILSQQLDILDCHVLIQENQYVQAQQFSYLMCDDGLMMQTKEYQIQNLINLMQIYPSFSCNQIHQIFIKLCTASNFSEIANIVAEEKLNRLYLKDEYKNKFFPLQLYRNVRLQSKLYKKMKDVPNLDQICGSDFQFAKNIDPEIINQIFTKINFQDDLLMKNLNKIIVLISLKQFGLLVQSQIQMKYMQGKYVQQIQSSRVLQYLKSLLAQQIDPQQFVSTIQNYITNFQNIYDTLKKQNNQ